MFEYVSYRCCKLIKRSNVLEPVLLAYAKKLQRMFLIR